MALLITDTDYAVKCIEMYFRIVNKNKKYDNKFSPKRNRKQVWS